ncbi:hypothetical protein RDI58_000756 [Solanum bulbocastanum]|uniref:Uncharacterized protein n=1 Tax=Solanum bulbocastanum TaxID=147425 RepID=A0AAN8U1T7_SOLBU
MLFTNLKNAWVYPIRKVDSIPVAISILSKEEEKVDVMIIYVYSLDSLSFNLLKQDDAFDIVTLFVCDEHNELFSKKAFENGTYMYLKKVT